jgi:crossover junction endodeoxyribonuclease RuvC
VIQPRPDTNPKTQTDEPLRVIGVDPGLADVGWGVVEVRSGGRATALDYGVIRTGAELALAARLRIIHRELGKVIDRLGPAAMSIEQLYFARNVKTAMVVAHGRAACILATAGRDVTLFEYTPLQIKQALTGHGRASKRQVQAMVRAVLGLAELPRPDHAADALAAALTHVHSLALARKVGRAGGGESPHVDDPRKQLLARMRRRRR